MKGQACTDEIMHCRTRTERAICKGVAHLNIRSSICSSLTYSGRVLGASNTALSRMRNTSDASAEAAQCITASWWGQGIAFAVTRSRGSHLQSQGRAHICSQSCEAGRHSSPSRAATKVHMRRVWPRDGVQPCAVRASPSPLTSTAQRHRGRATSLGSRLPPPGLRGGAASGAQGKGWGEQGALWQSRGFHGKAATPCPPKAATSAQPHAPELSGLPSIRSLSNAHSRMLL